MTGAQIPQRDWTEWRRAMHRQPELGFNEHLTAKNIADCLQSIGVETHTVIGGTGVVGVITRGQSRHAIGLRADIDALPIPKDVTSSINIGFDKLRFLAPA